MTASIPLTTVAVIVLWLGGFAIAAEEDPLLFITCRDGKLYEGNREFRFVSWNIPNLHNVEDAFNFLGSSPWRWPDAFEISDALETVRQMGGQVARPYVISVQRNGGDMGKNVHVLGPGQFNEDAFRTLDLVLNIAREKQVRIIIPLVDNWKWWGGVRQYERFRSKPPGSFWSDPEILADFKATVAYVVNRQNTLTGVRYCDDPTILGWETGNELDATPQWTRQVASYLKQLDPHHLVIDGNSLHGVPRESLDDPNINVVTTHHYPNVGNNNAESVAEAVELIAGRKAYFVGEFGFMSRDQSQKFLETVRKQGVSGALYWSLRFHRREGGFYWHYEPSGGDHFKAFHWPGFDEGEAYEERRVMSMLREAAFQIRGLQVPPLAKPQAPKLLEPQRPGLLSWQGAAGATSYDVERSTGMQGPWESIAKGVSDSAVQYRPLFADESAKPGVNYRYRVIARNSSGVSSPSNIIGPVAFSHRLLVDEFADDSQFYSTQGSVELRSGDDRKAQEDMHRLGITPGSSIDYRLDGNVRQIVIWAFGAEKGDIEIAVSGDGERFLPIPVRQQSKAPRANTDYGYLAPLLITAKGEWQAARYIRLAASKQAVADEIQLSRIELRYEE